MPVSSYEEIEKFVFDVNFYKATLSGLTTFKVFITSFPIEPFQFKGLVDD